MTSTKKASIFPVLISLSLLLFYLGSYATKQKEKKFKAEALTQDNMEKDGLQGGGLKEKLVFQRAYSFKLGKQKMIQRAEPMKFYEIRWAMKTMELNDKL